MGSLWSGGHVYPTSFVGLRERPVLGRKRKTPSNRLGSPGAARFGTRARKLRLQSMTLNTK